MPRHKRQRSAKNDSWNSAKKAKLDTGKMAADTGVTQDETPSEFEDTVVFLEKMRAECPNLLSLMNTKQAKLLAKSPSQPYDRKGVNEEYLKDMAAYFGAKQKVEDAQQAIRNSLLTPQHKSKEWDVERFEKQTKCLQKVGEGLGGGGRVCSGRVIDLINDYLLSDPGRCPSPSLIPTLLSSLV